MDPKSTRLNQREQIAEQTTQQPAPREFGSVEEVLRHDAAQTVVPAAVGDRLAVSVASEPKPARSWWQRLFSK